jgi:glutathione synthase/RimK-type ligase-like ATP-grasp enzyme
MCRTKLHAHSGDGIVIAERRDQLVNAPLYTQYVKKKQEYRIHVGRKPGGKASIIFIQRKAKKNGFDGANFKIRNLANGFVYVEEEELEAFPCILEEARKALEATGLAFGAVDIIYNEHQNRAYVLEINTAPGLEARTAQAYSAFFREIANNA